MLRTSAIFTIWHLKRNILGEIIVLYIQCINLCPNKGNLGKLLIAFQEMCHEQLKYFPVSSSTRYFVQNYIYKYIFFYLPIHHDFFLGLAHGSQKIVLVIPFRRSCSKRIACQIQKNYDQFGEKGACNRPCGCNMKLDRIYRLIL